MRSQTQTITVVTNNMTRAIISFCKFQELVNLSLIELGRPDVKVSILDFLYRAYKDNRTAQSTALLAIEANDYQIQG